MMSLAVDIKKDFGSFAIDVSFEAENGVHGLLGASGCGKSMTLKCIAGIFKPDSGKITLNDTVLFDSEVGINLTPQQRKLGLLFQNYALFPNMTVEQNIMAALHGNHDKKAGYIAFAEMIKRLGLSGLENHRPYQLSGGQQQRVALARILMTRPRLIMLDEPFSALDSYLKWQTEMEIFDILKDFGGITILVSHSRDEVYRMCDTVSVISDGFAEKKIAVKELFANPETLSSCLLSGCKNFSRVGKIQGSVVEALDWGVFLETGKPVKRDIAYVGVRAYDILTAPKENTNIIEGSLKRVVDNIFSTVIILSTAGGENGYSLLQVEMPKQNYFLQKEKQKISLYIPWEKIMLLRK